MTFPSVSGCFVESPNRNESPNESSEETFVGFLKNKKYDRLSFDWDTSRRDGLAWDEILLDGKLMLQIQVGVTKSQFKEWLLAESDFQPKFFLASEKDDSQLNKLWNIFFDFEKKDYK